MDQFVDAIDDLSSRFEHLARGIDVSLSVPSCPKWTIRELILHLGHVQSFWARTINDRGTRGEPSSDEPDPNSSELADWYRNCSTLLIAAVRAIEVDAPCWTWWGAPATAGAVARHQIQEAAVHLWDLERSLGATRDLDPEIADDGVAEFIEVHAKEQKLAGTESVTLRAVDSENLWTIGASTGSLAEISGNASDLVLLLHHRMPLEAFTVNGSFEIALRLLDRYDTK